MDESQLLAEAQAHINELAAQADCYQRFVEDVQGEPKYSDVYKRECVAEARRELARYHQQVREAALGALEQAQQLATQRLEAPGDPDTEARKARAGTRVGRLIDGGVAAVEAAAILADAGDVDGLRALRDEIPSLVRVTLGDGGEGTRKNVTESTLLSVDRAMAPLLTGADAAAAEVRVQVDNERARLDATSEYAFAMERQGRPTPASLITLAYANSDPA